MSDAGRVELIGALEDLANAAPGVPGGGDRGVRRLPARRAGPGRGGGGPAGRGVAAQVALARRESPHRGQQHLGLARVLTREMPHTLAAFREGRVSEWRDHADGAGDGVPGAAERRRGRRGGRRGPRRHSRRWVTGRWWWRASGWPPSWTRVRWWPAPPGGVRAAGEPAAGTGHDVAAVGAAPGRPRASRSTRRWCGPRTRPGREVMRGRAGQIMADTLVERVTGQSSAPAGAVAGEPGDLGPDPARPHRRRSGGDGGGGDGGAELRTTAATRPAGGPRAHPDRAAASGGPRPGPREPGRDLEAEPGPDDLAAPLRLTRLGSAGGHGVRVPAVPAGAGRADPAARPDLPDAVVRRPDPAHRPRRRPRGGRGRRPTATARDSARPATTPSRHPGWSARPRPGPAHEVETTTPTGHRYRSTAPPVLGEVTRARGITTGAATCRPGADRLTARRSAA